MCSGSLPIITPKWTNYVRFHTTSEYAKMFWLFLYNIFVRDPSKSFVHSVIIIYWKKKRGSFSNSGEEFIKGGKWRKDCTINEICIRVQYQEEMHIVSNSLIFCRRVCEDLHKYFSIKREAKYCHFNVKYGSEHSTCYTLMGKILMLLVMILRHRDWSRSRVDKAALLHRISKKRP